MTESEWLTCATPRPMLEFLHTSGKLSERKVRLFAVACTRRVWDLFTNEESQRAVEVGERCADGLATEADCIEARTSARNAFWSVPDGHPYGHNAAVSASCAVGDFSDVVLVPSSSEFALAAGLKTGLVIDLFTHAIGVAIQAEAAASAALQTLIPTRLGETVRKLESTVQALLIRDLFGLITFRPTIVKVGELALQHSLILSLAQAAYEERSLPCGELHLDRLAVLADALEDAGCTEVAILEHLRGPGPHVRGCWVVDLLLDRS